jgi:hypothetical protein
MVVYGSKPVAGTRVKAQRALFFRLKGVEAIAVQQKGQDDVLAVGRRVRPGAFASAFQPSFK